MNHDRSTPPLTARRATRGDIPFLAWCNLAATSPEPGFCYWDPLLRETGTPTTAFIQSVLRHDALAWGKVEQFFVLEEHGMPVAGASAFTMNSEDYRPLHLERLAAVARELDWTPNALHAFRQSYEQVWSDPRDPSLAPQASWIIESVAVLPEARGRGLTRTLFAALFEEGRRLGHAQVGISVTSGNLPAERAYVALGFRVHLHYGSDYFEGQFPGTTKYRLPLTSQIRLSGAALEPSNHAPEGANP
jgi:GNAT superfamily N-acetyltransferase